MNVWQAILLGVVEGLTEFLPVSSTGHLTLVERLLGWQVDDPGLTAFTAVIQLGAIAAVLIFFWSDIARLAAAWGRGLVSANARRDPDYRLAWYIIAGSAANRRRRHPGAPPDHRTVAQPVGHRGRPAGLEPGDGHRRTRQPPRPRRTGAHSG